MNYNIKITGCGTRLEIANALRLVVNSLDVTGDPITDIADIDGAEWEDGILMTEISAEAEVKEYGISDFTGLDIRTELAKCNKCGNIYYENMEGDDRNNNQLRVFQHEGGIIDNTFRGCPCCRTDEYLQICHIEKSCPNPLTLEFLKNNPSVIFATGVGFYKELHNEPIHWIAKVGDGFHDWAIYYSFESDGIDQVANGGEKVCTDTMIRMLVPCADEALALYRK